jgi:YggT family protein
MGLIQLLLQLYIYIIIADVIMSYVPNARRQKWGEVLHKIADAPQKPIREALPQNMPLDPTPMIIIVLIQMLMYLL